MKSREFAMLMGFEPFAGPLEECAPGRPERLHQWRMIAAVGPMPNLAGVLFAAARDVAQGHKVER